MKTLNTALAMAISMASPMAHATAYSVSTLAVGYGPFHVLTADFNQDGKMDLLSTDTYAQSVSVLLGNGDNSFTAAKAYVAGSQPIYSVVADINQDGKLDIITAAMADNGFSVLKGKSDGTFEAAMLYGSAATNHPRSVAVGDFNLDGKMDVVVANEYNHSVSVWRNLGNGHFGAEQVFATGKNPVHVAVADLNQDGRPDVVTSNGGSKTVTVGFMGANGISSRLDIATGAVRHTSLFDYNRDGKMDVLITNGPGAVDSNSIVIHVGDGKGNFTRNGAYGVDNYPAMVMPFIEDNQVKLVTANYYDTLSIIDGQGNRMDQTVSKNGSPNAVAVADFDRDGRLDFVVANHLRSNLSILHQEADASAVCTGETTMVMATTLAEMILAILGKVTELTATLSETNHE